MRFLDRFRRRRPVRNVTVEDRPIFPPSEPFFPDFVERLRDHCAGYSEIKAAYLYDMRPPGPGDAEVAPTLGLVISSPIPDERLGTVLTDVAVYFRELLDREQVPSERAAHVVYLTDEKLASVTKVVTPFFVGRGSRSSRAS